MRTHCTGFIGGRKFSKIASNHFGLPFAYILQQEVIIQVSSIGL